MKFNCTEVFEIWTNVLG
uniref:Uncharacterized protein n=1 Tax=Rhizophora mucronata TaxID=61149 RepID=A0A2P2QYG3_RHIMU